MTPQYAKREDQSDSQEPATNDVPMPPDDPARGPPVEEPPSKEPPKRAEMRTR